MNPLLQNIIALSIVAAAAGYVACRVIAIIRGKRKAGCSTCSSGCSEDATNAKPIVTVDSLKVRD